MNHKAQFYHNLTAYSAEAKPMGGGWCVQIVEMATNAPLAQYKYATCDAQSALIKALEKFESGEFDGQR